MRGDQLGAEINEQWGTKVSLLTDLRILFPSFMAPVVFPIVEGPTPLVPLCHPVLMQLVDPRRGASAGMQCQVCECETVVLSPLKFSGLEAWSAAGAAQHGPHTAGLRCQLLPPAPHRAAHKGLCLSWYLGTLDHRCGGNEACLA